MRYLRKARSNFYFWLEYLLVSLCTEYNYLLRLVELETKSSLLGDNDKVLLNTRKKMKDGALVDIFDEK